MKPAAQRLDERRLPLTCMERRVGNWEPPLAAGTATIGRSPAGRLGSRWSQFGLKFSGEVRSTAHDHLLPFRSPGGVPKNGPQPSLCATLLRPSLGRRECQLCAGEREGARCNLIGQLTSSTTPPSTRRTAPVVAEACGEQR